MAIDTQKAHALQEAIRVAWSIEELPQCDDSIENYSPDSDGTRSYYRNRDWKDVSFDSPESTITGLVYFTDIGLKYYISSFLLECLEIDIDPLIVVYNNPVVLSCFELFYHDTQSPYKLSLASQDQIACVLGAGIFIHENFPYYFPDYFIEEIHLWEQSTIRWNDHWKSMTNGIRRTSE